MTLTCALVTLSASVIPENQFLSIMITIIALQILKQAALFFLFVSFRFYLGTVLSNYFASKLTSPVLSALCSVMVENEVSLKRAPTKSS